MKHSIRLSFLLAIIVMSSAAVFSQATRVHFKPGAKSAVVHGYLQGWKAEKVFIVHVRKGQVLTTENASDQYITVAIDPPKGTTFEDDLAADCHVQHEVNPTSAGDYRIYVTECKKADRWRGNFKLRITVE